MYMYILMYVHNSYMIMLVLFAGIPEGRGVQDRDAETVVIALDQAEEKIKYVQVLHVTHTSYIIIMYMCMYNIM